MTTDASGVDFTGTYTADPTPTISGYVQTPTGEGIADVLIFADTFGGSAVTDENGYYELTVPDIVRPVPSPWTGTVTPCKTDWSFDPVEISYTDLSEDVSGQDYVGTYIGAGCDSGWLEEWVARYHGDEVEFYMDLAGDIAVDNLGNVYVTGSSYNRVGDHGSYDHATGKYSLQGKTRTCR